MEVGALLNDAYKEYEVHILVQYHVYRDNIMFPFYCEIVTKGLPEKFENVLVYAIFITYN